MTFRSDLSARLGLDEKKIRTYKVDRDNSETAYATGYLERPMSGHQMVQPRLIVCACQRGSKTPVRVLFL